MSSTLLPGFIEQATPRSVKEAVSRITHDRLKSIAKGAVERYIRRFLDSTGAYHELINAVAKGSISYVTDRSVDSAQDVTRRATQLARLFNDVREQVPAILIIDAGVQSVPSGLNSGLTHATLIDGKWQGWFCKYFRVPLSIVVMTSDQDSTDQLMEILELLFNNLRQTSGGSRICGDVSLGELWEVRLPLELTISGTTGTNITEDNKDQIWVATFDITVDAEDTFAIEMPMSVDLTASFNASVRNVVTNNANARAVMGPLIHAPDTIRLGEQVVVWFERLGLTHQIAIDRPSIATIDLSTRTITPRRPGEFNLMVLDLGERQASRRALVPVVATQQTITVTL